MRRKYLFVLTIFLLFSFLYGLFIFVEEAKVIALGKEDAWLESLTSVAFFIASAFFFVKFVKSHRGNNFFLFKTRKNIFFLLLAIVFFFAFGEEISWGQRIFGFETPAFLEKINIQGEFNIHNVNIFNPEDSRGTVKSQWALLFTFNRLFSIFWLLWCVLIPAAEKTVMIIKKALENINLPIVPIYIGTAFLLNEIMLRAVKLYISLTAVDYAHLERSLYEVREFNFSALFLSIGIYFVFTHKET